MVGLICRVRPDSYFIPLALAAVPLAVSVACFVLARGITRNRRGAVVGVLLLISPPLGILVIATCLGAKYYGWDASFFFGVLAFVHVLVLVSIVRLLRGT
jgi:hypothetical protein